MLRDTPGEENIIEARNWKNGALFYRSAKFISSKHSGNTVVGFVLDLLICAILTQERKNENENYLHFLNLYV